jgi:hypothetical protein
MQISYVLAYLDPGAGSMVIQVVVGGLLGGLLLIKIFWRKILAFLKGRKPPAVPTGAELPAQPDQDTQKPV